MTHFFKTIVLFLIFILAFTSCNTSLKAERQQQFILEQTEKKEALRDSAMTASAPKDDLDKNAIAHFNNAQIAHNRGEYAQAIQLYNEAIALNPSFSDAWDCKGLSRFKSGDTQGACSDWNKAIELGGTQFQGLVNDNCL